MFRPAASPLLFSALVGTGSQLAVVVLLVILFAILGELYTERGSLLSTSIFMYAATAPLNGYFGGSLYARSASQSYHDCLETLVSICFYYACPSNRPQTFKHFINTTPTVRKLKYSTIAG